MLITLILSIIDVVPAANPKTYIYSASITPSEVSTNQLFTYSINITDVGNSTLGSATIAIPAGFADFNVSVSSPSSWISTLTTTSINVTGNNGNAVISQGENVTVTFSATASNIGIANWITEAWSNTGWGGTALSLSGTQPTTIVDSLLTPPTISAVLDTIDQGQVSFISQLMPGSGGTQPYNYQWVESNDGINYSPIQAANGTSYSFSTTTSTATGTWYFKLNITDSSLPPLTSISNVVNVTLNPILIAPAVTATPNTINQMQTSILVSDPITTGTSPYTYEWFQKPPGSNYTIVTNNSPNYSFTAPPLIGSWAFFLQVTDTAGVSINSSEVNVIVTSPPVFIISVTQSNHGIINPGTTSIAFGDSQSFSISPDTGYHVVDVSVDGVSVGAVSSYTFNTVTTDHNITAIFGINQFFISASTSLHGTINPVGIILVDWNNTQSFTIIPDTSYHVADVMVDGISVGPLTSYTFVNIATNHSIFASFNPDIYSSYYFINVTSSHGAPTPSAEVEAGSSFTASVTSPEGNSSHRWLCIGYSVDGGAQVPGLSFTFMNIQANHTITFNWQEQYYLSVNSTYGSSVGGGWYDIGSIATASISSQIASGSAGSQYIFTGWIGDASGSSLTSNTITMNGAKTATANWKTQYYLTVSSIFGNPSGQGWYDSGSSVNITVTPIIYNGTSIRNAFAAWTGSGAGSYSGSIGSTIIMINAPINETASWNTQFLVNYVLTGNSLEIVSPANEWVNSAAQTTGAFITSVTNAVGNIKCNFIGDDRPKTINAPTTITGAYKTQFLVTFNQNGLPSGATGMILSILGDAKTYEQLTNTTWVNAGDAITFAYTSTVKSSNSTRQYTLTSTNASSPLIINEPTTIQANYKLQVASSAGLNILPALLSIPLLVLVSGGLILASRRKGKKEIKPIVNRGGFISPSITQKIERDKDSTVFIITANSGYTIKDVIIDKTNHLGPVRMYKFTNVNENHTISAEFEKTNE